MKGPYALALITTTLTLPVAAQNWSVGVPVDMQLSTLDLFGGCAPNSDYTFNFPASLATGVEHVAIVTNTSPPGTAYVVPGGSNLNIGDTIHLTVTQPRVVYLVSGGSLSLDFRAVGTPTMAGDAHPCAAAPLWISNLLLCPEGVSSTLQANCNVQLSTGLADATADDIRPIPPQPANGYHLQMSSAHPPREFAVCDLLGRSLIRSTSATALADGIDMNSFPEGTYLLIFTDASGARRAERFALVR